MTCAKLRTKMNNLPGRTGTTRHLSRAGGIFFLGAPEEFDGDDAGAGEGEY